MAVRNNVDELCWRDLQVAQISSAYF